MILSPSPAFGLLGSDGTPASGYQMFSYAAGSTTKQDSYTDDSGNTALPNPILLNTRGDVAASAVGVSTGLWLDPALTYKFVFTTPTDSDPPAAAIWTLDNVVNPVAAVQAQIATYEAQLAGVPIGGKISYGGTSAPSGWLLCYGQAVSRSTYALLFAVIGTSYGAGDTTTTFNLPDARGRTSVGKDDMGGVAANRITMAIAGFVGTSLGAAGGDQQMWTHSHAITDPHHTHPYIDPGHAHVQQIGFTPLSGAATTWTTIGSNGTPTPMPLSTSTAVVGITLTAAATGITVNNQGSGSAQNVQPSQVDNVIIYAGA